MKKIALTLLILALSSAHASSGDFSWYDLKDSLDRKNNTSTEQTDKSTATKDMIWDRYKVRTSKKTINQIIEDQTKSNLAIGLEIQSNPTYTYDTIVLDGVIPVTKTISESLPGTAIYIKGNLDFSPIGGASADLNAKVALSNTAVDFDVNKRLYGTKYSTLSVDAGIGLKSVVVKNDIFSKGFYGYGTASINYLTENYQFNTGFRALMSKPAGYSSGSDVISPFFGAGLRF
jgi:hypothetical protein